MIQFFNVCRTRIVLTAALPHVVHISGISLAGKWKRQYLSISSLLDIYTTGGGERWNFFQNETGKPTECADLCFSHSSLFVH
jgi:hypothetical protein